MTIHTTLQRAKDSLKQSGIQNPGLDSEVLLAFLLDVSRSWLHAHGDQELTDEQAKRFQTLVERRKQREPVAYIVGKKEFYGREFIVTPDALIPRPETEDLIDLAKGLLQGATLQQWQVLDIGTGSGCVGITLKLERPQLEVMLSDISKKALHVAHENAKKLGAEVTFVQSDLLSAFSKIQNQKSTVYFDLIVANLPYVNKAWETSSETTYEPSIALFADAEGLALIRELMIQSTTILTSNGHLILEADPEQHEAIILFGKNQGLIHQETQGYALSFLMQR